MTIISQSLLFAEDLTLSAQHCHATAGQPGGEWRQVQPRGRTSDGQGAVEVRKALEAFTSFLRGTSRVSPAREWWTPRRSPSGPC